MTPAYFDRVLARVRQFLQTGQPRRTPSIAQLGVNIVGFFRAVPLSDAELASLDSAAQTPT